MWLIDFFIWLQSNLNFENEEPAEPVTLSGRAGLVTRFGDTQGAAARNLWPLDPLLESTESKEWTVMVARAHQNIDLPKWRVTDYLA